MKKNLLFLMMLFICGTALGQRVKKDTSKNGQRIVNMSGYTFDIKMRSHKVSLTYYEFDNQASYSIDVYTYVNTSDNSEMSLKLFNGEELILESLKSKKGAVYMLSNFGPLPLVYGMANYTCSFEVTEEQLTKIFTYGIQEMCICSNNKSRSRTWKKDKVGQFLKKSYDKLELRLKK